MKITALLPGLVALAFALLPAGAMAQRVCGTSLKHQQLAVQDPQLFQQLRLQQAVRTQEALALEGVAAKSTGAQYPIPVVFHVLLTQAQYNSIGGDTGIRRRVFSQLKVINDDFNRRNADSTLIPGAFKSRYTNVNIQFGLAKGTSSSTISEGIELKILPPGTQPYDAYMDCYTAKEATAIGLPAWDVSKYLNIWVGNISAGGSGVIVGVTTAPSSVGLVVTGGSGNHTITANEKGVVLNYGALGVKEFASQYFIAGIDKGRTLTHELGHYFELWHIWGDDGGACTVPGAGLDDDYIPDTPPQGNSNFCNSGVCPTFPKTDACSPNSPGVMFMNYMDYVDDKAMMMFTHQQALLMQSRIMTDSDSYSLTQNPQLLLTTGVPGTLSEGAFQVFPNPATAAVQLSFSGSQRPMRIELRNMMGQQVATIAADHRNDYQVPVAELPRGIYFVQCHFAEGTLTKKIVLQ